MNKLMTKIVGAALGLTMAIGVGVAAGSNNKEISQVNAAETEGSTQTLTITRNSFSTSGGYAWYSWTQNTTGGTPISGSAELYTTTTASMQFNKSKGNKVAALFNTTAIPGSITKIEATTASNTNRAWNGYVSSTAYSASGSTLTSGSNATSIGSNVTITTSSTTIGTSTAGYSYFCIQENDTSASYLSEVKITYTVPTSTVAAYVDGDSSVNAGTEYTAVVKKTSDDSTVSGTITYTYTPSNGAALSSPTPNAQGVGTNTTGKFTASAAGKITVSATLSGYTITSKEVTINSITPYINLTLTSGDSAYTGQTVAISAEYGNGVAGLNWSVQAGSISGDATASNSGYSAKIGNSSNPTLTIRATDTGSALYSEVSVTVTKTAFTTSPAATASVVEGKTTTLSAVLNSSGTINWDSDDTDVATVSNGVVTGVAEGTTTITATSADDTSVYAECEVTVTPAPSEVEIAYSAYSSNLPASGYAAVDWSANGISGKVYSTKNNNSYMQFQANTSYIYNSLAVSGYITSITITKASGSYSQLTAYVADSDGGAITSKPDSGGTTNNSDWSWTFSADDHYCYFRIDSTSTGAKYFSKITIGYQKVQQVDPTGITLNNSDPISMDTYSYGRRRLSATVEPFNNNDPTVNWGTSNSSVVTVADGVLTAVGVGSATVYATTSNYVNDQTTPELKASVSVTVTQALYKKATFVPTSTSAATQTDDYLADGSVSLSASTAGSWNTDKSAIQLASGKDVTFTISGYAGMKITGIDLVMSSNGNAGSGSLTVTAGSTDVLEIEAASFDDESWNNAYDALACDIYKDTTDYVVSGSETITFAFAATANSLYVHSVSLRYLDYSLEQWCEKFLTEVTCTGETQQNPNGAIVDDSTWDDLGLEFLDLDSDLIAIAATATADKNSENVIERAMARYDLILRKYGIGNGAGEHDDFIGRFGEGSINGELRNPNLFNAVAGSNTTIIVVIISLASISAFGAFLFLKKRKEQ